MRTVLCLVVLSVVSAGSRAQSVEPLFPRQIVTAKPSYRSGLRAADVDADGDLDLITANGSNPGFLTVNLGDGHGFFPESQETWVGGNPFGLACGDVDGDGRVDVAVSCEIPQQAQIALGVGDGTFMVSQVIAVGQSPRELVLEDFDSDGDLDVAVTRQTIGGVVVALGDGTGGFGSTATYGTAATQAGDLAAADLDQDGDADLVVAFSNLAGVQIFWNDGSGGFAAVAPLPASTSLTDVLVADLTGDSVADIVGAPLGGNHVQLLVGLGRGSFAPAQSWGPDLLGSSHSLAVADINGDGALDLAVSDANSELVRVLLNQGGSAATLVMTPAGEDNGPLVLADVNRDGLVDLLAGSSASDNSDVTVVLNTLDPLFEVAFGVPTPTISEHAMARGDVDGDGLPDIVLFGSTGAGDSSAVAVLEYGSFALLAQAAVNISSSTSESVWSGDLDGDGRDDVVVPDVSADALAIVPAQAGGGFGPQLTIPTSIDPTFVVGADVDGDGDFDLVTAHRPQATVAVHWNDGSSGFSPPLELASAANPDRVVVRDLDADGLADLVVLHTTVAALSLYRGTGGHGFAAPVSIAVGNSPDDLEVADFDRDGDPDLAVTETGALRVLLGDGSSGFVTAATFALAGFHYVTVGDLDGDGIPDLLTSGTTVNVFRGHGDGSFVHAGDFEGEGEPDDLLLDTNSDGTLDLVVASGGLEIHPNAADELGPLATHGAGLAGSNGTPHWSGLGTLQPQSPLALTLAYAKPAAPLTLVLGLSVLDAPFKGGTMVPQPQLLVPGLAANAAGQLSLSTTWPAGIPSGFMLATQCWIVDPAGPAGLSASNGLVLTAP